MSKIATAQTIISAAKQAIDNMDMHDDIKSDVHDAIDAINLVDATSDIKPVSHRLLDVTTKCYELLISAGYIGPDEILSYEQFMVRLTMYVDKQSSK